MVQYVSLTFSICSEMRITKHLQCLYTDTHPYPKLPQIMELRCIVLCAEFKTAPCAPHPLISCQAVSPCLPLRRHKSDNASASEADHFHITRGKKEKTERKVTHLSLNFF